jgi:hypothetical protein
MGAPGVADRLTAEYLATTYKLIVGVADAAEAVRQVDALEALRDLVGKLPPPPDTFLYNPPPQARSLKAAEAAHVRRLRK